MNYIFVHCGTLDVGNSERVLLAKEEISGVPCLQSQSQNGEENIMIDFFFKNTRNGTYVEIGALDGVLYSNTLRLHTCLNWNGLLIEGNRKNYGKLVTNVQATRPDVQHAFGCVCAPPKKNVMFLEDKQIVSGVGGDINLMPDKLRSVWHKQSRTVQNPCKPMSKYLKGMKIINFFSLDVEGAELEVLETIDFTSVHIDMFLIELDGNDLSKNFKIRQYLFNVGYVECTGDELRTPGSSIFILKVPLNPLWVCPSSMRTVAVTSSSTYKFKKHVNQHG